MGGAATYAALTASRMGLTSSIVTSVGPRFDLHSRLEVVDVHIIPSSETTTFENIYREGRRTQYVKGIAGEIGGSDIPSEFGLTPLVMLAPLVGEVNPKLARAFAGSTVLASIQGWLRGWDGKGLVSPVDWEGADVLPHVDATIFSVEYIRDSRMMEPWIEMTPVVIATSASHGATLYLHGLAHHIDPFPTIEVDPTGAGDVFGAGISGQVQGNRGPPGVRPFRQLRGQLLRRGAGYQRHTYQGAGRAASQGPT